MADRSRTLRYHGRMDDNHMDPSSVKKGVAKTPPRGHSSRSHRAGGRSALDWMHDQMDDGSVRMSSLRQVSAAPPVQIVQTRQLRQLENQIVACRRCPRLVRWRERVAEEKVKRFAREEYWGRPLPGFGDANGRLLLVGLAPGAHGGNRTGRMFTGDDSGTWLFRALHKAGFANQPASLHRNDGLRLTDCYITAMVRCAPPDNKPLPGEFAHCRDFLMTEVGVLTNVKVVVGLGRIGFDGAVRAFKDQGRISVQRKPAFAHAGLFTNNGLTFIASYHPSRQNTNTKKLTEKMLDDVLRVARQYL